METATAAAAAGGTTTVIDMPLNSFPCTTTAELLLEKMKIAEVSVQHTRLPLSWGVPGTTLKTAALLRCGH
jgi:allantoinase